MKWELDNGSADYALGELRRRIGRSWDSILSAMVGAIDRSGSAIIQADTAKTLLQAIDRSCSVVMQAEHPRRKAVGQVRDARAAAVIDFRCRKWHPGECPSIGSTH